jgi:hypothetical protein
MIFMACARLISNARSAYWRLSSSNPLIRSPGRQKYRFSYGTSLMALAYAVQHAPGKDGRQALKRPWLQSP